MSIAAEKYRVRVDTESIGMRLDQFLAAKVPDLSRRRARVLIDIGGVFVDRARVKVAGRKLKEGQLVEVNLGGALERATKKTGRSARAKDAEHLPRPTVLFEDEDIVVVCKPAGLLSAPTPESDRGNLLSLLQQERTKPLWIVHRLDLDTSGILVVAASEEANTQLGEVFRDHRIDREYLAVVDGTWPEEITQVDHEVGGKAARSHFFISETIGDKATIMRVRLETGRTHQIRLHASGCGHSVLGDRKYGHPSGLAPPRMALHAQLLAFAHPRTGEALRFTAPLPDDLQSWIDGMRAEALTPG